MSHSEYDIADKNDANQSTKTEYTVINGKYWEYKQDDNKNDDKPFVSLLKGNQDYPTWITSDIKEVSLYIIENLFSYNKYSTKLQQTLKQAVDAVFNEYSEIKYSELLHNINNIFNLFL
ncbi:hypothetical protein [Photorhabdus luminescens]|uniref:hypothetical protein n=1 Tax=Photorhabdus luminescens TaxID=29488 RepID=UPI00210BFBAC|nr:hypothetical protein [Photorhabdus luminescens]